MRYYTSIYSSAEDLLAIVNQRLKVEGWAEHKYADMPDPRTGKQLHISRDGLHFGLRSLGAYDPYVDYYAARNHGRQGVIINLKTGFDGGVSYSSQPGFQFSPKCYLESGDKGICHIFTAASYALVVTNYSSDQYSCLVFGKLPVFVDGTGGQFVASTNAYEAANRESIFSNASNFFGVYLKNAEFTGFDRGERTVGTLSTTSRGAVYGLPHMHPGNSSFGSVGSVVRSPVLASGYSGLIPVELFVSYGGLYSPYSQFSDLFYVSLDALEPGQTYEVGDSKFMVFPQFKKEYPLNRSAPHYNLGLAVFLDKQ
ncbi:hypothetical protein NOV18_08765 [Pseudomonas asiatica]|uniref:Uncharacterized protein n=1 Tax=Pseudomonas asiatica TaxID=2219225 RepID=A0AAJ5LLT3_9PSED|nr:hypothetical protein [Pseudomonas asiatica]UUC20556.1 hypothetical protein NOV18_08765 [Pseudomonas asiatica]